jgi:hypothetical protein
MVSAAPIVVFVPYPVWVGGSSFPRVIGHRYPREHKTPNGWPPSNRQQIPGPETQRILDNARRDLAEAKARRLLRELDERRP